MTKTKDTKPSKGVPKIELPGLTLIVGYDLPALDVLMKLAGDKSCLVLDRPEAGEHPVRQRAFARSLARHVSAGGKALVATHSDYLIKELNILIMLGGKDEHLARVRKNHYYAPDEALDHKRVRCYTTEVDKNQRYVGIGAKCPVDEEFGIEVPTFDGTINEQNDICTEIRFGGVLG